MSNGLPKKIPGKAPVNKKRVDHSPLTVETICPDFQEWPESWRGEANDVPYGEGLIELFRPFLQSLIDHGWSKSTIRKHSDNLWLLGGEIIREVHDGNEYRRFTPRHKLIKMIGPNGGPYSRHLSSAAEVRSFEATCKKLYQFLQPMVSEK